MTELSVNPEITETVKPVSPLDRLKQLANRYRDKGSPEAETIANMLSNRLVEMRAIIAGRESQGGETGAALIPALLFGAGAVFYSLQLEPDNLLRATVAGNIVADSSFLIGYFGGGSIGRRVGTFFGKREADILAQETIDMFKQAQPEQTVPSTET